MIVVADAGPIRHLVLIEAADALSPLYSTPCVADWHDEAVLGKLADVARYAIVLACDAAIGFGPPTLTASQAYFGNGC